MGNQVCDACCEGRSEDVRRLGSGNHEKGNSSNDVVHNLSNASGLALASRNPSRLNSARSMFSCCSVADGTLEDTEVMFAEATVDDDFDWSKDVDLSSQGLTDDELPRLLRHLEHGATVVASHNGFTHAGRLRLAACSTGKIELEPATGLKPVPNLNTRTLLDLSKEAALTEEQCKQLLDLLQVRRGLSVRGHAEDLVRTATRRVLESREAASSGEGENAERPVLPILRADKKKVDHMALDLGKKGLVDGDLPWLRLRLEEAQEIALGGNTFSSKNRADLIRCARKGGADLEMELGPGLEPAVKHLVSVPRLVLATNCFKGKCLGTEGCEVLAPALGELTQLQVLELRDNYIGQKGMKALAASLRCLTQLQHLGLGMNSLGDAGAEELAPVLRDVKGLHTLGLDFNNIGKDGAFALAPALSRLGKLQNLYLFGNNFKEEAMSSLGPTLDRLKEQGCDCAV